MEKPIGILLCLKIRYKPLKILRPHFVRLRTSRRNTKFPDMISSVGLIFAAQVATGFFKTKDGVI